MRYFLLLLLLVTAGIARAQSQPTLRIGANTRLVGSGSVGLVYGGGSLTNNGSLSLASGQLVATGPTNYSGTGTATVANALFDHTAALSTLNSQLSVTGQATVATSTSLNANGQLYLRTDLFPSANLVNNGLLTGTVLGLVTNASQTSATAPFTSTLSTNVSGSSMQYQWQSSPDNSQWSNVSGATSATYPASVSTRTYYRCLLTTTNTNYSQTTPVVELLVPSLTLTTSVSPNPVCAGSTATVSASVTGGSAPYSYTLSVPGGSNLTGSTASTAFSQSLTASGSGVQTFTLAVSSSGQTGTATTSVIVNALPTAGLTDNGPLTCAQTSVTLTASGGTSYTFTNGSGTVLAGSGNTRVVSSPGTYSVTVANASGCVSSTSTSVMSNTSVVTVSNPTTTTATVNSPFSQSFTASNGQTPYSYSLASGTLPTGLTLASTGVLSGTPTQSGSFPITVRATDANGCSGVGATYTLVVNAACSNVYTVTTITDAGPGSLRQAMLDIAATSCPGPFTITAAVSGTINLASVLPGITKSIAFIGPGASNLTVRRSSGGNYRIFSVSNTVSFDGFTIADGFADQDNGGGILNSGILTLSNCIIRNNRATYDAGGVRNQNSLIVNNCRFEGNMAGTLGGGIYNQGTSLSVVSSTFMSNTASSGGGLEVVSPATVTNCSFLSNVASYGGGMESRGSATVTNCTFSNNTGNIQGGAFYTNAGTGLFINTTISSNKSNTGGGVQISNGIVTTFKNCIIAGNTNLAGTAANDISNEGDVSPSTYNVIGTGGSGGLTNGVNNNIVGVNALLAPLGNYGGTTQTRALLPGSPAINAGTSSGAPTADQRGVARVGVTDIGSFESQGFTLLLTSGNNQSATVGTVFTNPLRTTVSSTNSEPVDGGVVTYTGPGSGAGIAPASVTASIASGVAGASVTANATTGGPYTVAATANGASPTVNFSLTNTPNIPTITGFTVNPQVVCVGSPITFTATIGNVPDGYNWSLSNGGPPIGSQSSTTVTAFSVTQFATGSGPQTYTLTVTGNGQQVTATTSLTVNVLPVAGLSNNGPLTCAQTSVTLTASGGTSYSFSPGATQIGTTNQATVTTAGVYSVTVANAGGCTSTASTTISSDASLPTATLSASPSTTLTCAQISLTLTAGGGNAYAFSGPGVVSQSGNTAVVNAAGVYSVTVTNTATGCASTTSITISRDAATPTATLSASPSTTLTCAQTSLTLTAGGGNAYAFSGPGVVSQSGNTAVVNAAGVYSVTVTNTATGCASTTSITISQDNAALSASLISSGNLSCAVTSVTLTASPGQQTYTFSAGATQIGSTNQATVSTAGTYSVTVLAGNGCSSVASVTVSQDNNAPSVSIAANPSLTITQGQSATLTASVNGGTPPFGYSWSTTESTSAIVVSTQGPYSVTVTGANGCSATTSVTVTVNPVVSLPFAITGVTTVSCTPILPNRFSLSFDPRYQGLNGQPVSFSVTNELFPTTAPGPYTLQLYTDNPTITLEAAQSGVTTRYSYNWLEACRNTNAPNTPPRVVSGIPSQTATVGQYFSYVIPAGTFTDDQTPTSLRLSATGLPTGLSFSVATLSGTPSTTVGSPFSVTITATDPGNLSVSTSLQLTVLPGGNTPPPTDAFSITGVTTISCTPVANRISLSFAPRYAGLTGQPIAFEVVNESIPTTAPAPYSLTLYRDNPVITLRASQTGSGGPVTFLYNWLDACSNLGQDNTPPRLNEPVASQTATVGQGYNLNLSNTFTDQETPNQISLSASGLPAGLSISGKFISGTPSMSGVSSVTLTATDGGGLNTSTSFSFTVYPAPVTPPPTAGFSITGVQAVSCEVISAGQRRVTFRPQYAGLDGSPVSFSVANELAPTTQAGPYVLNLYTDNPVITLSAVQRGLESRFSYGWLSACQGGAPRVGVPVEIPLSITVLGNPVLGSQVEVDVRGAQGQQLSLSVVNERGYVVSKLAQPVTAPVERIRVQLGTDGGVYYLQAHTATGSHTVKLVKQ